MSELATLPPNPLSILQAMTERGADPDQLSKIMDLCERYEKREAEKAFADALAGFQKEVPNVFKRRTATVKTNSGGEYKYQFESFDDVMKEIGPVLAKWGIVPSFSTEQLENPPRLKIIVRIRVGCHFEEHTFSCPIPSDVKISEPQKFGQALSYAKRYGLKAALNIVSTDMDNDAAGLFEFIGKDQVEQLKDLIAEKDADLDRFLKWAGVESLDKVTAKQFVKCVDMLNRKTKAKVSA